MADSRGVNGRSKNTPDKGVGTTEALEVGANDAVAGTEAAEVVESVSVCAEILAGAETAVEFLPVLLL